tara:strand:- start:159 stop:722 length:564 start_codon:yes stop_codon:yes gene_type:complete
MKKVLINLFGLLIFSGCSPKLKVYDVFGLMEDIKTKKDNYYIKDVHNYYDRLKGNWIWTNNNDTLILKSTRINKKRFGDNWLGNKNTFYDTNEITYKYIKDGKEIIDQFNENEPEGCLFADHLGIYTNMFYVYWRCGGFVVDPPVLLFIGNDLVLINKWNEEEGVFLEKEGKYKIIIPRTITLKRME